MSCDICGAKGKQLTPLLDQYKSAEIQDVCPECEKILNDHNSKLLTAAMNIKRNWMRRFIDRLHIARRKRHE